MSESSATDEWFCDGGDVDGAHESGGVAEFIECFFEGDTVDDGAEHPHVVSGGLWEEVCFGERDSSDDVSSADDDRHFAACFDGLEYFLSEVSERFGVDSHGSRFG